MVIPFDKTASLSQLSLEMGVNKSRLNYYAGQGLIKPVHIAGNTMIFDKASVKKLIRFIEAERGKGMMLKDIKAKLDKKKNENI